MNSFRFWTLPRPGDVLILYGTGLGPPIGGVDTTLPLTVISERLPRFMWAGSHRRTFRTTADRLAVRGLTRLYLRFRKNAPIGCQVSIVVQTSNLGTPIVSNGPATAIAPTDHGPCVDPVDAFSSTLLTFPANSTILGISLQQNVTVTPTSGTSTTSATTDTYQILATGFTPAQFAALAPTMAESSNGSCFSGYVPATPAAASLPAATYLDIGPSITLTPPSGSPFMIPATAPGVFLGKSSAGIPAGLWGLQAREAPTWVL